MIPLPDLKTQSKLNTTNMCFSDDTIRSLQELGSVLMPIYKRLIDEGYVIKNGKIVERPTLKI